MSLRPNSYFVDSRCTELGRVLPVIAFIVVGDALASDRAVSTTPGVLETVVSSQGSANRVSPVLFSPTTIPAFRQQPESIEQRVRRHFEAMTVLTAAATWPERDKSGVFHTPGGKALSTVFVIRYSRPRELDGWPFTAYVSEEEKQYWVHEGGDISGINRWFGPFCCLIPFPDHP